MMDIRSDMAGAVRALERVSSGAGGRSVMLIGSNGGEGVSSAAASLAVLLSGRSSRGTWLIDLNLLGNGQYKAFERRMFSRMGMPGRAMDASLKTKQFYQVVPQLRSVDGRAQAPQKLLAVHKIENTNLFVTKFRGEYLNSGQKVQIRSGGDYWHALRRIADWTVVDAPSVNASSAGLAVCRYMDGVILVVEADQTEAAHVNSLREEIAAHGGQVIGVVVNQVRSDARLVDKLSL
tara:strand:+ start:2106 stop:2810 length:705 start_codon:yes stop_codon:yes gene_type:complete